MSKTTVTRLFVGSIVAIVAGVIVDVIAVLAAFAGGVIVIGGPDGVSLHGGSFAWTLIGLAVIGSLAITGGSLGALVSWIGALINTAQLEDKTWFVLLLVLGLFSFGFVAMFAYVIAGPDAYAQGPARTSVATATPT